MIRKDSPLAGAPGSPEDMVGDEAEGPDTTGLERRAEVSSSGQRTASAGYIQKSDGVRSES